MSYFKGKLSQFVVNRYPRYIFKQIFPLFLINVILGQEPRVVGLWLGPRVHGCSCYFCCFFFVVEREDNNPYIAFLKARLPCH